MIETPECWGIINFQKSLYCSANEKKFTVNLAIAAKRILRFNDESEDKPPRYYASHWQNRIGHLIHRESDRWWTLTDEASYEEVFAEAEQLIAGKAVSLIKSHLSEADLLALWDVNVGGFEYPTLKCKSILLAERGELGALPEFSNAYEKSVTEAC